MSHTSLPFQNGPMLRIDAFALAIAARNERRDRRDAEIVAVEQDVHRQHERDDHKCRDAHAHRALRCARTERDLAQHQIQEQHAEQEVHAGKADQREDRLAARDVSASTPAAVRIRP